MTSFLGKHKLPIAAGVLMLVVLPISLFIIQSSQEAGIFNYAPRAAVEKTEQSKLTLSADTNMPIGQEFDIGIRLDTTKDPNFLITGVDAIIKYDPVSIEITQITQGTGLDTITNQTIDPTTSTITISLSNSTVQDSNGNPVGYSGETHIATLKAKALKQGKTQLSFVYTKPSATNDTNVIGFRKDKPVADQSLRERLLTEPPPLNLTITNTPTPSATPSATPNPTCTPRPGCLDTKPACKLPTPIGGYCPPTSPTPNPSCIPRPPCLDPQPGQPVCLIAPAPGTVFCPPSPHPSATPLPTATAIPAPQVSLEIKLSMLERTNGAITGTLYGIETNQVQGVTIAQGFDKVISNIDSTKKAPATKVQTINRFTTNSDGTAIIEVPTRFQGKRMNVYVRTVSHIVRQAANNPVTLPTPIPPCIPGQPCPLRPQVLPQVEFSSLIPGDIYIAPNQTEQDNLINTFDALELVKNLGKTSPTTSLPADLNGDGTVNARDYQILLANLGKTGDPLPGQPTPTPSLAPHPSSPPITYEECIKLPGSRIQETYPPICVTADGRKVTQKTNIKPGLCPDVINPVCASDGQTYNNECEAQKKGLYWTRGACNASQ